MTPKKYEPPKSSNSISLHNALKKKRSHLSSLLTKATPFFFTLSIGLFAFSQNVLAAGNADNLIIGGNSKNPETKNILPPDTASVNSVTVGKDAGTEGTLNIGGSTGSAGAWSPDSVSAGTGALNVGTGGAIVGDEGKGTLNIGQQGVLSVKDGNLVIGNQSGSNGTMNVSPASAFPSGLVYGKNAQGETESSGSGMVVGNRGTGTLNIIGNDDSKAGAAMGVNGLTAGAQKGGTGNIMIDGKNAGLNDNGNLIIGQNDGASGNLTIKNGSGVSVSAAAMNGSLIVGQNKGSTGTITVDGKESVLLLDNGNKNWNTPEQEAVPAKIAIIGDGGNGTLNVTNGGTVDIKGTEGLVIGNQQGAAGIVNLGTGSSLKTPSMTISKDSGKNTLTIDGSEVNVGDGSKPADNNNGYVKVGGGGLVDIKNGGTLTIDANPIVNKDGSVSKYPTLQIGTTPGDDAATVTMDHGTLDVSKGQIQVGDLLGQPSDEKGGAASLTATDSTIKGGFQVGIGGNSSSTVALSNSTYDDKGQGVIVGINGDKNTFTQQGGTSNVSGGVTVGYNEGGKGTMTFDNGAKATINNGLLVGFGGDGTVNVSNASNVVTDGLMAGYQEGASGTVNIKNGSALSANDVSLGDDGKNTGNGGTGVLNIDGSKVNVGDGSKPADDSNGFVKVGAGSAVNITNGGSLKIDAEPADGNYPTLQIGTTKGDKPAEVTMDHGTLDVSRGQIQVGDLAGATNDPNASGDSAASLTATNSTINGGLQVGIGGNSSSTVTLSNSTYDDKGQGVIIGDGAKGSYSQNGGTMTVSGEDGMVVGSGIRGSGGTASLENMDSAHLNNVRIGADATNADKSVTGGKGDMTISRSKDVVLSGITFVGAGSDNSGANGTFNLNSSDVKADLIGVGYGKGNSGTVNVNSGSTVSANAVIVGKNGGTGSLNIDSSTMNVGDPNRESAPQDPANGYVKVGAGSAVSITGGGTLNIDGKVSEDGISQPTLQIGSTPGDGQATVSINGGNLHVDHGYIQVGDLSGQDNDPNATGGGTALLQGDKANITGGLQVGLGGNSASTVNLTDSTYDDKGQGVIIGDGAYGSYSQNGGTMTVSGEDGMVVGSGLKNSGGTVSLKNMDSAHLNNVWIGADSTNNDGSVTGGNGEMSISNSKDVVLSGTTLVGAGDDNSGAKGTLTLSNSEVKADLIGVGYGQGNTGEVNVTDSTTLSANAAVIGNGGTGSLNIDGSKVNIGDGGKPANPRNGFAKVGAGGTVDIRNGGLLKIDAQPIDGGNYPTLQIGTTTGNAAATVNVDHGTLDVSRGQIQVGDLVGATDDPNATGGGAASLTATNSTINGGFQVGTGGNSSSTVTLTNTTYNDKGQGVIVGINGDKNTFTQSGGTSNVSGGVTVGYNEGGKGTMTFDNGAKATINNGLLAGFGGDGTVNVSNASNVVTDGLMAGADQGSTGTININDASTLYTDRAIIGADGTGTVTLDKNSVLTIGGDKTVLAQDAGSSGHMNLYGGSVLNAHGAVVHGAGDAGMSFNNATFNATGDVYDNVNTSFGGQNALNTDNHFFQMDGKLSGDGGFDKTGSGILQINNTQNDYHGTTNIQQGTLEGIGTIGGDLNIGNGALLRPGISDHPPVAYGRMTVNGNTVMEKGSTLEANLGNYPQNSGLTDKGSFTIQDGTTLKTTVAEGAQLKINQAYDVVHADKGVSGKFTSYQQDGKIGSDAADGYAVLKGDYGHSAYTPNDVNITLTFNKDRGLSWDGDRNQTGIGNQLSPQVGGNGPLSDLSNILAGQTNAQRLHNLTQMDGEIASDMRTGNINQNFWIRDSVNNRLDCLEDTFRQIANGKTTNSNVCGVTGKKVNIWGTMYGSQGGQSGHSGWNYAKRASDNNAGFIWGVDGEIGSDGYAEDRWHVGMMMGYGSVMESAGGVSSKGESNNANIGMYFGKQVRFDNQNFFTFHGQFGYTWNIMSWHRTVNLQGDAAAYNQTLHAHELGGTAHVNAEIAYKHVFNLWGTPLEIAPTGSITYLNYEQGSYHETGGNLALHGRATNTNMGYGFMGAKIATNFNIGDVVITPHGKFGYRRSFGANQSYTHLGFEALGGDTSIGPSIVGVPVVQDEALTELGFDIHPTDYLTFGANYVGLYGGHHSTMSGGQLSAKIAF